MWQDCPSRRTLQALPQGPSLILHENIVGIYAIAFHIETFGTDVFRDEETVLEAYVTETGVTL